MKKLLILVMALAIGLSGCGTKSESGGGKAPDGGAALKEGTAMQDIYAAADAPFDEFGVVAMSMDIDETVLSDIFSINASQAEDFYGKMSFSNTNSDVLLCVRAKEGELDAVKKAMEQKLADIKEQFAQYPVMGSLDRANSGEVYVKGDCVFLIVVGVITDENAEGPFDFSGDVSKVKTIIDGFFTK